jgi:AhpD family alkylhydroperoxidase
MTHKEILDALRQPVKDLREHIPTVFEGYAALSGAAMGDGALDAKTKELIALGIAVAVRCDDCIAFHVKACVEQGATKEEVSETLGMAIYMGAGPSVMYASHALEAFTQFEAAAKPSVKPAVVREEEEIRLE